MDYRAVRGMRDVLPEEIPAWERLESTARRLADLAGYREVRPPLLEETDLFIRSVGEVTDIVEKEMFTVRKADHSFTLRPEGTAGIVRAYVQAGYAKRAPLQKLFTIGPMFRYEKPQKGRERQFTQFDMEAIGSLDPRLDVELIDLAARFFEELGIRGLEVRINSMGDGEDRDRYREAVREFVRPNLARYSEESRARFERNVLRVLDSKHPGDVELNQGAPRILDFLSDENRAHFEAVERHLRSIGRTVVVDPGIVRGLDYYTRTIFELHYPDLGARSALCGGGRYDHLVEELGGPDLAAVGFAIGFTGTLLVLEELGLSEALAADAPPVYVAAADPACDDEVFRLVCELRGAGLGAVFDSAGKKLGKQLKAAGTGGHAVAAILGPDELAGATVQLKVLATGEQRSVPRDGAAEAIRDILAARGSGATSGERGGA
jgi:histidyl-tRNA synthetase